MKPFFVRSPRVNFKTPVTITMGGKEMFVSNISLEGCSVFGPYWFEVGHTQIDFIIRLPYSSAVNIQGEVTHANMVQDQKLGKTYKLGVKFNTRDPRYHEFETWLNRAAKAQKEKRVKIFESSDDIQTAALLTQLKMKKDIENGHL